MKIIFRFSYLSAVLHGEQLGNNRYPLAQYLVNSSFNNLTNLDISKLPKDYNGDNYDLILDKDCNLIKAEKDLEVSEKLADKLRG